MALATSPAVEAERGRTSRESRILICDDQEVNVLLLERMLEEEGYLNVEGTTDSSQVVGLCARSQPDLLLLDLHMPPPDGFEVMRSLGRDACPVLVLTADVSAETKARALSAGASDFLTKPFDGIEAMLRIERLLETRRLHLELRDRNARLERAVTKRTRELDEARAEVLRRLALAAEYRDDVTGEHAERVGRTAARIWEAALGFAREEAQLVGRAATLHDVGKIGVPDAVLLKPGRLTDTEYEAMKAHVEVGRRILSGSSSRLLRLSEDIALSHHERWDGRGYPAGLVGEQIPLAGRVTAIADVFDVLTHERPYKPAWAPQDAVAEIESQAGRQFDPTLVEAFAGLDHEALLAPVARAAPGRFTRGRVPAPVAAA